MTRLAVLVSLAAALIAAVPVAAADTTKPPPPREPSTKARVLLTGDSMMYVMQFRLFDRLTEAGGVPIADSKFSTGITKPWILDWHRYATAQTARFQPDVTLMAIGANDHFSIEGIQCCSGAWRAAYTRSIRDLARSFGPTYWILLPLPRSKKLATAFRAVNRSILAARPDVAVINLTRVFAPTGVARKFMTYRGKRIRVHQRDGVHLSKPSIAIANGVLVRRLQRDGVLPPPAFAP